MTDYIDTGEYRSSVDKGTHYFSLTPSGVGNNRTARLTSSTLRSIHCHIVWLIGYHTGSTYFEVERKIKDGLIDPFEFFKARAEYDRQLWKANNEVTVKDFHPTT